MKIIDNGVGFSEKSKKSNSIGVDLINSFAEDLNADLDFNSSKKGVKY